MTFSFEAQAPHALGICVARWRPDPEGTQSLWQLCVSAAVTLVSPCLALWGTVTVATLCVCCCYLGITLPCPLGYSHCGNSVCLLLLAWYHPALPSGVQSLWQLCVSAAVTLVSPCLALWGTVTVATLCVCCC